MVRDYKMAIKKNLIIMFVMLLMLSMTVSAYTYRDVYTINIDTCYGQSQIDITSKDGFSENEIEINGCAYTNDFWYCPCKQEEHNVVIRARDDVSNVYDIIIEYMVQPEVVFESSDNSTLPPPEQVANENNKRTKRYFNVPFNAVPEEQDDSLNLTIILSIIFSGIVFLALLGWAFYVMFKKITQDDEDVEKFQNVEMPKLEDEPRTIKEDDEELNRILNDINK
jgi:hypothetical protein